MRKALIIRAIIACAIIEGLFIMSVARADYLGSWNIDDYITITASMHDFNTGAAAAATGDVNIWIYKDATEAQIYDDTMAAFDSITGLYLERVELTAAAGFEAAKHYTVLIQATVDGVAAITTHNFQILAAGNTDTVLRAAPKDSTAIMVDVNAAIASVATKAVIQAEVEDGIADYDPPTNAELEARTLPAASYGLHTDPNEALDLVEATGILAVDPNGAYFAVHGEANTSWMTETIPEMGQGAPPANPTIVEAINYLYRFLRNKKGTTATTISVYADNESTVLWKVTIGDDGTTFTQAEAVAGD